LSLILHNKDSFKQTAYGGKQMGTRAKNDKLDLIASIFEGNNFASFNICCEDLEFKKLLIENATRPTGEIVSILSNYANENLI